MSIKNSRIKIAVFAFILIALGMACFEWGKMLFHPGVTLWESHILTIFFSGFVGSVTIYFLYRGSTDDDNGKTRIKLKILLPIIMSIVILVAISIYADYFIHKKVMKAEHQDRLDEIRKLYNIEIEEDSNFMSSLTYFIKNDSEMEKAFLEQDRAKVYLLSEPIFKNFKKKYNVTHFYFITPDKKVFFRIHKPGSHGDTVVRNTLYRAEKEGKTVHGVELGKFGTLTLRVVSPWFIGDRLIGYLELGVEIAEIISEMEKILNVEMDILIKKELLIKKDWQKGQKMLNHHGDWDSLEKYALTLGTIGAIPDEVLRRINENVTGDTDGDGGKGIFTHFPLTDYKKDIVGYIYFIEHEDYSRRLVVQGMVLQILLILTVGLLFATMFYIYINRVEKKLSHARIELINSRDYVDNVLKTMLDALVVVTPDAMIRTVNQAVCGLLGYEEKELIGQDIGMLFEEFEEEALQFKHTGISRLIKKNFISNIEKTFLAKNGEKIHVLFSGSVMRDDDDNIKGIVCVAQDITGLKHAEKATKESESKYRSLFQNSVSGYAYCKILFDEKHCPEDILYLEVNPIYEKMTGMKKEDLVGKKVSEVFPALKNNYPEIIELYEKVAMSGENAVSEIYFEPLDKWLHISAYSPRKGYFVALFDDITPRKQDEVKLKTAYEELEATQEASLNIMVDLDRQRKEIDRSLKEKELLLREIHHRVKNNMQVISSLLSLQAEYVKDEKALGLFEDSRNRIKSMALIHEKTYQSKDLSYIDFDDYIRGLADDMLGFYSINVNEITVITNARGVSLGIDSAVPCGLIINELLSNCLKHSFPGGGKGKISINMKKIVDSTIKNPISEIELIVSDNGVGIPEGLDIRNSKSLGMELLVGLAEHQLDGSIEVKRNKGTEFKIRFKEKNKRRY